MIREEEKDIGEKGEQNTKRTHSHVSQGQKVEISEGKVLTE